MSTLLENQIKVNRIVTTNSTHAKAIEDPIRVKILHLLYNEKLTVERITAKLKKLGINKAVTTVRHHIEILKDANLVEVVKIEEARGAIIKYYGTSIKILDYDIPKDFDKTYDAIIKSTETKLEKLLKNIQTKSSFEKSIKSNSSKVGYDQYLILEIVNRAATNIFEQKKVKKKLKLSN